jgi:multidrug efflux pump subunit AcrB
MNIAELSIRKSVITWVMTILILIVGAKSFFNLSWLEDPEFTIKDAVVTTPYPGASAAEVEEEVTNVLEKAIQQMGQLFWVESESTRGVSSIKLRIKDKYDRSTLPQVWDELRRKVSDYQAKLPPGAGPSIVNDDFGDVFGVYLAITGEGYTEKERYEFAKLLQRELLKAKDVKRIELYGVQNEAIYVEMRRDKMSQMGISQQDIYNALAAKNLPVSSGYLTLGDEYIPVNPTGEFTSEQQFRDLLIRGSGLESDSLVYLGDVADVVRGYKDPAKTRLLYDAKPAIGLGISTVQGGNVVSMGKALKEKFRQLESLTPIGMEIHQIYMQSDAVVKSIKAFLVNLAEAIAIVVVVLLVFMGLRSGLIIGFILLVTIMGTFIFMDIQSVTLERISLGALVIALGMLVDNAIVVTDGMKVRIEQGMDALGAAKEVVGQTGVPLLAATFVAIAAFASIGTSQDASGEYCRTLFSVILISLTLSWLTAVTVTPLLCKTFLKPKPKAEGQGEANDLYAGAIFRGYKGFLSSSIRFRWVTMGVVLVLFVFTLVGFGSVPVSFFPDSTSPQFYVDFWFPQGTHIDTTTERMKEADQYFMSQEGVQHSITMIGGTQIRFLLTYTPAGQYPNFAQILVHVDDYKVIPSMMAKAQDELEEVYPGAVVHTRAFVTGPATGGKIQLRISGPDPSVLRELGSKVEEVLYSDPGTKGVRNEWGQKIKVVRPQMAETPAKNLGITRPMIATAIESSIDGTLAGVYRENDELIPIVTRSPETERVNLDNLSGIQVWSPVARGMVPLDQVITGFKTEFEDAYVSRRDRVTMMRYHVDPRQGLPSDLKSRIKPRIEKALGVDVEQILGSVVDPEKWTASTLKIEYEGRLPLKDMPGYFISWGGEFEDQAKAQGSLAGYIPIFFGLMILIVLCLFNSIKKTLVIWLTVPLAIIGVTVGLLLLKQPFGFMALLGLMSLAGMLIKNAIVLVDEIDTQLATGKQGFNAIVDSSVSRLIPVSMAAMTTILGMMPLLKDAFFISMAVTIMFGLLFATVLTLIVVPVLYAIFFKVENQVVE